MTVNSPTGYAGREGYIDAAFRPSRGGGLIGCGCTHGTAVRTLAALPPPTDGLGQTGAIVAGALQVGSQVVGLFADTPAEKAAKAQERMMRYQAAFKRQNQEIENILRAEEDMTLERAETLLETNAADDVAIYRRQFLQDLEDVGVPEASLYADLGAEQIREGLLDNAASVVLWNYWPFMLLGAGVLGFGAWQAWQYFT